MGTDKSGKTLNKVDLYPGGFAYHIIFATDYCEGRETDTCLPAAAGLYDYKTSNTSNENMTENPGLVWTQGGQVAQNLKGNATIMLDTISMNTSQGLTSVPDSALDAVSGMDITLPNGASYSPQVGSLALGSLDPVRKYPHGDGQIFPNYLAKQNITPSASTSLHYGSANLGPEGSLVWGGYDQSRVIDKVGHFEIAEPDSSLKPNLLDIQIGVEIGGSPFEKDNYTGLLALNETFGMHQPTVINPTVPYLFLPPETCGRIADKLPVTFNKPIGFYTWNVDDPQYKRITTSPAYLAFVFPTAGSASDTADSYSDIASTTIGNLTIKIPFALLDLTLQPPIVATPQPYFPCSPLSAKDGTAYLGRTFLQAAFLAMNFETSTFFMGQAPGPDIIDPPNVKSIAPNDTTISSSPADRFARSWEKHWTPLPPRSASDSSTSSSSSTQNSNTGLSKGAIAGITIASILAVLSFLTLLVFLLFRRKRRIQQTKAKEAAIEGEGTSWATSPSGIFEIHSSTSGGTQSQTTSPGINTQVVETGGRARLEAPGPGVGTWMAEMEGQKALPELPTSRSFQGGESGVGGSTGPSGTSGENSTGEEESGLRTGNTLGESTRGVFPGGLDSRGGSRRGESTIQSPILGVSSPSASRRGESTVQSPTPGVSSPSASTRRKSSRRGSASGRGSGNWIDIGFSRGRSRSRSRSRSQERGEEQERKGEIEREREGEGGYEERGTGERSKDLRSKFWREMGRRRGT